MMTNQIQVQKPVDLLELQKLASDFCLRFDDWIIRQSDSVQFSGAMKFGPEYDKLHELLTRLNTGDKESENETVSA